MNALERNRQVVDLLAEQAASFPELVHCVDWATFSQIEKFELRELVAMSVSINPAFSNVVWMAEHVKRGNTDLVTRSRLFELHSRLTVAARSIAPDGDLQAVSRHASDLHSSQIRIQDFVRFAKLKGWTLPDEFPGQHTVVTRLELPWKNEKFERLVDLVDSLALEFKGRETDLTSKELANRIIDAGIVGSRGATSMASCLSPERPKLQSVAETNPKR